MVVRIDALSASRLAPFIDALNQQRAAIVRCVESLRNETEQAMATRDLSDLYDEAPTLDVDAEQALKMCALAEQRLAAIDAALTRVASGSFGVCTSCGEQVSPERLAALPATPVCLACAGRRRLAG